MHFAARELKVDMIVGDDTRKPLGNRDCLKRECCEVRGRVVRCYARRHSRQVCHKKQDAHPAEAKWAPAYDLLDSSALSRADDSFDQVRLTEQVTQRCRCAGGDDFIALVVVDRTGERLQRTIDDGCCLLGDQVLRRL